MKRQFPCGHKGKGQYCHRCKQADQYSTEPYVGVEAKHLRDAEAARLRAVENKPATITTPTKRVCRHVFREGFCVMCDEPSAKQRAYMEAVEEKMTRSADWRESGESDWREGVFGDIRARGRDH